MFHRADTAGGQPHPNLMAQDVGQQGRHLKVWKKATTALVVGVADIVAAQHALACNLTAT